MRRLVALTVLLCAALSAGCKESRREEPTPAFRKLPLRTASSSTRPGGACERLCKVNGRCQEREGKCYAISAGDCQQSGVCRLMGNCSLKDGACVVSVDDDCKRSEVCRSKKMCTAANGKCVDPSAPVDTSTPKPCDSSAMSCE